MKKHYFVFLLILLQACNADQTKKVDLERPDFETDDASELFFKNIRQSSYRVEENTEGGLVLFRHKEWPVADEGAVFVPVIVFNWRQDKAYMMIEWLSFEEDDMPIELFVHQQEQEAQSITYTTGNMKEQLLFLTRIYNGIVDGASIMIIKDGVAQPFFQTDNQRQLFRVIMFDYFRLTGLY